MPLHSAFFCTPMFRFWEHFAIPSNCIKGVSCLDVVRMFIIVEKNLQTELLSTHRDMTNAQHLPFFSLAHTRYSIMF